MIKYSISPVYISSVKSSRVVQKRKVIENFESYKSITDSGMFKVGNPLSDTQEDTKSTPTGSVDNLTLLGTITGPPSIQRAFIKKRGGKYPQIFALWKINKDINNDVFGYKLIKIRSLYVMLDNNGEKVKLEIYKKKKLSKTKSGKTSIRGSKLKKNISRAEIKQKVFNNLDNAMKGLVAGPYREGGKIVGFRLKKVRPYNILYKLGARSGDVVKRINGKSANSTMRLMKMWESLKTASKITVDLERRGRVLTYDFNITE